MKHFNTSGMVMLIALLNAPLCRAAAEEPINYSARLVKRCSMTSTKNMQPLPYMLVQLKPMAPYESTELTQEEKASWFPPRPEVVDEVHYDDWSRHVDTVFNGPFQAPAHCDTANAQQMMQRDYAWFVQDEQKRIKERPWGNVCVPVSLKRNLVVVDNKLAIQPVNLAYGLRAQQQRLTDLRVQKIEQYRLGLLIEISGRQLCPTFGCQFKGVRSECGQQYIVADAEPQEVWEKLDASEPHHVVPEPLGNDPAADFFDSYIKNGKKVKRCDRVRANALLNRYVDIWNIHRVAVADIAVPVVVAAIEHLVTEHDKGISLNASQNAVNGVLTSIAKHLAQIRQDKDMEFFHELRKLQQARDNLQACALTSISVAESHAAILKPANRLPRAGGFFAGLGWAGSVWFATYLLRSCQDRIRVASGCASAAAGMAFLFARHKLAQASGNAEFWQGMHYAAGASVLASAGLFAAHDSSAVQKLLAIASRQS